MLTLNDVLPFFGSKKAQLAHALGISRQAISNWSMDDAIPEKHELKIRYELVPQLAQDLHAVVGVDGANTTNILSAAVGQGSSDDVLTDNNEFKKSAKLADVLYDIRGPVLIEANRLEEEGQRILKLNVGNPGEFGLHAPVEIMQDVIHNLNDAEGYCDSRGLFPARKAIMQHTQLRGIDDVDMNDVYMGNGVSELIVMCAQALLNDGDEVLIPSPDYPLWTAAVTLAGGKAVHYICDEESDWQPDLVDIKNKVNHRTKAIVVINPNNPTGAVYSQDILEKIAQLAVANGLLIFSDEIYDKILYDDAKHIPMASVTKETLVVTFNGLSKSYRLAGFRSGWMIMSGAKDRAKDFLDGIQMLSNMRLCANVPGQLAVQTALGGYQSINDLILPGGCLLEQRDMAYTMLNEIPGVSCVKPRGALYVFPKLDPKIYTIEDDEQFALDLLKSKHILVVQGTGFNWKHTDHLRIVFLPPVGQLQEALEKFTDFLSKYRA